MMTIKNIKQFKELTSYGTVILERFWDGSSTASGGTFLWDPESVLTEIPGLIIKPTTAAPLAGGNKGRWVRQYSGAINVDWFGASNKNQTMSAAGISQVDADARYGVGFCNVTVDTLDTVAISYAFKLIEIGYSDITFSPKNYYINRTLWLPKIKDPSKAYDNGGSTDHNITKITGPAYLKTVNTNTFTVISRVDPVDQNDAEDNMQFDAYVIENLNIRANSNQILLSINSSYMSIIRNCFFTEGAKQLDLQFCMKASVENCHFRSCSGISLDIGYGVGKWAFASNGNASTQSNGTSVKNCRFVCNYLNAVPVFVNGCDNIVIEECVWEGPTDPEYNVIFDAGAYTTVVKNFAIRGGHVENKPVKATFKIVAYGGIYIIDGIFVHQKLQRFLDVKAKSGNTTYVLQNMPFNVFNANGHTFSYDDSDSPSSFDIRNCEFDQNIHSTTTRWVGGNKPPAYGAPGSGYGVRHTWVPR